MKLWNKLLALVVAGVPLVVLAATHQEQKRRIYPDADYVADTCQIETMPEESITFAV
jgi:hypothetical protein